MTSIAHGADAQPSHSVGDAPNVKTPAGAVRGTLLDYTTAAYLGIPYAEPPVGPLRFALPEKRAAWEGVRDARRYGATPLRDYMTGLTLIPEPSFPGDDTLTVNVFTPRPGDPAARLPVYVYIHGGGFTSGSPSSSWWAGGAFPRDGVVVVSISYRLGFDGFGVLDGAPDNRAVHDWLLALEWVRDSIAGFGGDPGRVTIGGQSAGGTAVLTLLSMPSAQGLFSSAVAQSPGAISGDRSVAVASTAELAKRLGVAPTRDAFTGLDERVVFAKQSAMSGAGGMPFVRRVVRGKNSMVWTPVVDGDLIPYGIDDALGLGIGADKHLLIGANAHEFDAASEGLPAWIDRIPRRLALVAAGLRPDRARAYAARTPAQPRAAIGRLLTDSAFRFTVARVLAARTATTAAAPGRSGATFAYDFRLPSATTGLAGHCIELPFVWDCLDAPNVVEGNTGPNPPQATANLTHRAWVSFISGADPGWPAFEPNARRGMVVTRVPGVAPVFQRELALTGLSGG